MDRFLTGRPGASPADKGGARRALPFFLAALLLALCVGARADETDTITAEDPNLDAGVRVLVTKPSNLDSLATAAGFPTTGGAWLLWGGGATITPGSVRAQVSAWEGGLSATQGTRSTQWEMGLAALTVEQRYPSGQFIYTAGVSLEAGQLEGSFINGASLTGVEAPLFGGSAQVGVRWPAQTKLAFFLRAGYEYLAGSGTWHGTLGQQLGSTLFELGGPTATLQLELSF